ncbi:MAG: Sulfite reductase, dissimilatory-type subunit gamma [Chloroflexi bacterium]|nr:Sulfite reductase, dissimilatory-type subunit gamma [Chloroflexota bacterium]
MSEDILDTVEFDDEGFMVDASAWTEGIGQAIAEALEVDLTDRHWLVINYARKEFEGNGEPPTLRRITTQTDVSMKEMYKLFPGGPAKIAANIAGLKKPTGCI